MNRSGTGLDVTTSIRSRNDLERFIFFLVITLYPWIPSQSIVVADTVTERVVAWRTGSG